MNDLRKVAEESAVRDIAMSRDLIKASVESAKIILDVPEASDSMVVATLAKFIYEELDVEFMPVAFAVAILDMVKADRSS